MDVKKKWESFVRKVLEGKCGRKINQYLEKGNLSLLELQTRIAKVWKQFLMQNKQKIAEKHKKMDSCKQR
jgi:cell division protein FtsB